MEKLNTELINKIWLTLSTCTYLFSNAEEENIPIVPEDKTHEFLLKNFTINNAILDFYYSHTNRFFSEEEYEKIKKTGYVGRKEHTLKPYPLVIFGAYFNRVDLIIKLQSIIHQDVKERPKLNGNSVEHFSDLIPYFKKYAEGFKNGYENFEQNCINEYLPAFPDKNDYIYKVFEYLTKRIIFEHDWYNNHCGFTISRIVDGKKIDNSGEIVDAYENGQKQGFFYRAWSIVFSNNNLFAPLFEQKTKEALPPQQRTTEKEPIRYTAKHYVLAYVIECNAKGESFPVGQKKELEKIGNRIMGAGKGNRFYKVFNEIVNKDLNIENNLIEIGGENWRTIVKDLSNEPETIETYLQNKQL